MTKVDSSKMNTGKIYKGEYEVFLYKKQDFAKLRRLEAENAQLKELLKECKEPIEVLAEKKDACDW